LGNHYFSHAKEADRVRRGKIPTLTIPGTFHLIFGFLPLSVLLLVLGSGSWAHALTETLYASQDSFLSQIAKNTNLGAKERLEVQKFGRNRTVVNFDMSQVTTEGLAHASLVLTIKSNLSFGQRTARRSWPIRSSITGRKVMAPRCFVGAKG